MSFYLDTYRELTQIVTLEDSSLGIMKWGTANAYPQTLKNLIEQSPSAKSAVSRTAKFYKGAGFKGEDQIVNPYGMTLKDIVAKAADDYATFQAFGIQTNFNINSYVVSMIPMAIETLRFNQFDELNYASKLGYNADFGSNAIIQKQVGNLVSRDRIKWIDRFNPKVVEAQIKAISKDLEKKGKIFKGDMDRMIYGIGNYQGQILYHSDSGHSSYPLPLLQAPINFVLSDVENSILMRKETATGFINSYILKTTLDSEDPTLIALEKAIDDAQGARGSGKVITLSGMSPEDINANILEEIGSGAKGAKDIVDTITNAYNLNQKVINGVYLIPPILAGADQKTGFSSADLDEAYKVFNAITQEGRDVIEAQINRILKHSKFKIKEIKIEKLKLDIEELSDKEGDKKEDKKVEPTKEKK